MAEGKITQLLNGKKQPVFPITSSEAVYTKDGKTTLEEALNIIVSDSANNMLLQNSGYVRFTTTETSKMIEFPFITHHCNVIIGKTFFGDVKVTKGVGDGSKSIQIDVKFNGDTSGYVDYLVIPYEYQY